MRITLVAFQRCGVVVNINWYADGARKSLLNETYTNNKIILTPDF